VEGGEERTFSNGVPSKKKNGITLISGKDREGSMEKKKRGALKKWGK